MRIAGIQKNSFVDYPGNIAAVVFTPGCNLNCYFCHNRHIINPENIDVTYDINDVMRFLDARRSFLDGVVISGGEPTFQPDLEEFIVKIKGLGYLVKLDTNGTRPSVLEKLINKNLVDYIAMDIKAPFEKYNEICGVEVDITSIQQSIEIIMNAGCDYEFRTTFVPNLNKDDILEIARTIRGAKRYVLQQFRIPQKQKRIEDIRLYRTPYPPHVFAETISEIAPLLESCLTRGVE
ncbi:anaerobic ribonucleoside-triphosphate reductase activating protein [Caldicoprobacter algeriensis]|uniref:anaerobic ribonucleoside-triphosphate reductase activating protein n=1 Tax=Caldicoprobacter algeriensis TaxID=699281 RepID=UPI00207A2C29|nr:anaerobic ribonucleoside-triphosphate reductase activating protein [Caldicoprobacter algeriensis]MCM8900108.1 anaerobic ribonucleoside-triphosphate reductase activating protein [Caldicoprobacter algeriensis]